MGITFLAAGTSVPEAVSSVIVAKQGELCIYIRECALRKFATLIAHIHVLTLDVIIENVIIVQSFILYISSSRSRIDGNQ